jgi:hypothetical protein
VSRFDRPNASQVYRFVARVSGCAFPTIDKAIRLRCTLSAADHTVIGVSSVAIHLGTDANCCHIRELVHEIDSAPPRYFEVIASLAPVSQPRAFLRGAFAGAQRDAEPEYRIAGLMDPAQRRIVLPVIALRST